MDLLEWLVAGTIPVGSSFLSVPEVLGNVFGLASAILGMRRWVLAWPIGLLGNTLLFFVFTTGSIADVADQPLWGQAGRQVFFAAVSLYGWWRWTRERGKKVTNDSAAIEPRWATWSERAVLVGVGAVAYGLTWAVLAQIGSWSPPTEAWIVAGSMLATWGMARGWVEFWLVWMLVDLVGVISLVRSPYPAHATVGMYLFYAFFVVLGFFVWWRAARTSASDDADGPAAQVTAEVSA
ncbi:MAG: nicotinamide riboside transporter PnuC [Nocardioides sp.]|uniref:nicotinamide mononucleotide transporter family protein n=1 Tax=Nocardioides sp. TaxID=35761 RepID=UPI003F0F66A2